MTTVSECPICYEKITLPYRLECFHSFCYLCIKRAYESNQSCPYCRHPITEEIYDTAKLQGGVTADIAQWLYSGKNFGWWKFDPNTDYQLELAYREGQDTCTICIMGRTYLIDFNRMEQRSSTGCKRKIKHNDSNNSVKGIAGLRVDQTGEDSEV